MQTGIYFVIFLLLIAGLFCIVNINPLQKRIRISIAKNNADEKRKQVDEKYAKLKLRERVAVLIKNTVSMSGFDINTFWLFVILSGFIGVIAGKFLFAENVLSAATGVIMLPVPYIILKIRARW